eukprot:scaffold139_cov325-Pavlova_lutheri.AAC.65
MTWMGRTLRFNHPPGRTRSIQSNPFPPDRPPMSGPPRPATASPAPRVPYLVRLCYISVNSKEPLCTSYEPGSNDQELTEGLGDPSTLSLPLPRAS